MSNSRLLLTAEEIRAELTRIKPTRIAVAYVGEGWSKYLPPGCLEELVVSPTLGSNPRAIESIMNTKTIGHQNVYFLDTLHAKIYLGEEAAVVGSCNLSDNGLSDGGNWEAAVLLEDRESVQRLENAFRIYKKQANKYPNEEAKLNKLRELISQRSAAIRHGIIKGEKDESGEPPLLRDYESALDTIHISPFHGTFEYNEETLGAVIPEAVAAGPESYFRDTLAHDEGYNIEIGDWLLCWRANQDGRPSRRGCISWLHAHHVVPNGAVHDDYTKLIGEANPQWLTPVRWPFRLGPRTQQIIRDTLNLPNFRTLWNGEQRDAESVKDFLQHVRRVQENELQNEPGAVGEF